MEEILKQLESYGQDIDGIIMVPISTAIQAVQLAKAASILEEIQKLTANMQEIVTDYNKPEENY